MTLVVGLTEDELEEVIQRATTSWPGGHQRLPESVGLHTLRHSADSTMLAAGVALKVVSEILGYSSIVITGDIYAHVSPDVSATAMETLSAAFA